ncbi:MAG: c-type cytochrome [Chromatocurvus sp.]
MRFLIITFFFFLSACDQGADSPRGFSLPRGDADRGEQVFLSYECLSCHRLDDYNAEFPEREMEEPFVLGGQVTRVKTYAELVTAVINPSHKISQGMQLEKMTDESGNSRMRNYNDVMTVSELIDLVAFLETHYEPIRYPETQYIRYYP